MAQDKFTGHLNVKLDFELDPADGRVIGARKRYKKLARSVSTGNSGSISGPIHAAVGGALIEALEKAGFMATGYGIGFGKLRE